MTAVSLRSGEKIECGAVINCAGVNAWRIAAWIGLDLPVRPRKRLVYVIDCREELTDVPLTIDPTGVWFRPEGANFICGVSPEEHNDPDSTDFELDYSLFEELIWPTLANRVPAFEAIKLIRAWAGHYDYNVLDQNVIMAGAARAELPDGERVLGARPAAIAGDRPRAQRARHLRQLPDARPAPLQL